MDARNREVLTGVPDLVHFARVGEDTGLAVALHRVILPGSLPQLVKHLEILVGDVVTVVVLELVIMAHVARRRREVTGDDVPAHPTVREVVERGHPPGEGIGMLVGGASGDAEAEVVGNQCHCRH